MNLKQFKEREMTIAVLIQNAQINGSMLTGSPSSVRDIEKLVDTLHRYETTLHRLFTEKCNRELNQDEINKIQNTKNHVLCIADMFKIPVYFNDDPRGGAIRFILPSKRSNNMGGEDWGIYW